MESKKLFFAVVFLCASAFAQNALVPVPPVFLGPSTAPRLGANLTITFCTSTATLNTCLAGSAFAQAYADSTNSNPINQTTTPLKTDALGNAPAFFAAPGLYSFAVSGPGVGAPQGPYQITVSCIPGTTCVATSANNAFTGNNTHSGTETFSGPTSIPGGTTATFAGFTSGSYNSRQMCDQATGADVGAKINTCIANTSAGGIADATGMTGTCTTNINFNKSITLWVGQPLSGPCQLNINTRNVSIIGMGGQSDFSVDSTLGGTTWTYTGTTGNHINVCTNASGCGSGLFIMNMTFIGNSSGTTGHGFASIQGSGVSQCFSSFQMVNVHFTQYAQDGIHMEDCNFNFNWYKVASFSNKGHGLLLAQNVSTVSTGQFRCFTCSFENNTGTDAGYGSIPSSNKLAQVRILGPFDGGFWGGTIADTPPTNANGVGMELGASLACPGGGGPQILLDSVHFEQLGIGTSVAVDTKNNAIYNNACLGSVIIRSCLFVINPGPTGGNNRNAIVNDANTQGTATFIGPGNVYSGGYVKGYDGSLEVGSSTGSVTIFDDPNHLPASAVVQNGGNQGSFYWNGGQYIQQLLRFGGTVSFEINSAAFANQLAFRTTAGGGLAKYIANDGTLGRIQTSAQSAGTDTIWDDSGNWRFPALFTKYNSTVTAGQGVAWIPGATPQKAETGAADANVLTVTPAAAAGTYRACFTASVSAATSGVIGWTLSWTDSNGNAQANIAQSLVQQGTAAPALTFTTSAAGNYQSCSQIDVNNAAASIIVKWVGGGTTTAKVSATIERLQ